MDLLQHAATDRLGFVSAFSLLIRPGSYAGLTTEGCGQETDAYRTIVATSLAIFFKMEYYSNID
jgi:hypothetical protein